MAKCTDKAEFKRAVYTYADKMKVKVKSLALRPMSNKWASCSTDGNLNFNKDLLDLDKELAEYVIVHELQHFNVPNHGKLRKSLMTAYLGDYEKIELKLKQIARSQPNLQAHLKAAQAKAEPKLLKELAKPTHEMQSIHERHRNEKKCE
jgi:predicted metal-dependent hydrolase